MGKYFLSVSVLIAANLIPLVGVFYFGWDAFSILLLYWLENAVTGFYAILKLRKAAALSTPEELKELKGYRMSHSSFRSKGTTTISPEGLVGWPLIRFFIYHYGGFMLAHALFLGVFIFAFKSSGWYSPHSFNFLSSLSILTSFVSLMASHGISYKVNFLGKQEFLEISPARQLMQPYRRIGVMHLTIVFGALAFMLRSAKVFLVTFILAKILVDVLYHLKEHGGLPLFKGFVVGGNIKMK
ncbi:MAG: DUF6498-containing protein [Patescibacteria group bacterium]